jgi:hypothetical protein
MGIYIWVELVCGTCAEPESGQHVSSNRIPKRQMLNIAKKNGGTFKGKEYYCRECSENENQK